MSTDANTLNKITNQAAYLKDLKDYTMTKWDLTQECTYGSTYKSQSM